MPSAKRRLKELEEGNRKVAKTNVNIASFFKDSSSLRAEVTPSEETNKQNSAQKGPSIDLDQRKKNSGHSTTFSTKWQDGRPWLICKEEVSPDGHSFEAMYCTLCTKWSLRRNVWVNIGCTSLRLDAITCHERSAQHKESMAQEVSDTDRMDKIAAKMNTKEFRALVDAQKVMHFLIEHNLPHTTLFKPLIQLCIELGATNLSNLNHGKNANYTSHRTIDEFLDCQAQVIEEKVTEKVKNSSSYGLMLDEYTDISARKHLALVVKYIDNGASQLAFLQDIQLPNGSADIIYTAMKNHLKEKEIPLKNLISFASDGPSVMVGRKNGVVAKLKQDNPHIIPVHCMNHRLQLAVSKSFHSVTQIQSVDELLSALFKYYHYSTVKSESLQAIQNLLRDTGELENSVNLTVKKAVHTRWLSHENAVQTIRRLYVPICKDLENAVAEGRDKKLGDKTGIPAGSLLKMLRSYEKIYFIHLLCDVCSTVGSLTRLFEKEQVDLSIITPKLQSTLMNLEKMKVKDGPYTSKVINICNALEVEVTTHRVIDSRDKFLNLLVEKMEDRLEHSELVSGLAALDLSQLSNDEITFHGDQEVTLLAEHLGLDSEQTMIEWNDLKELFRGDFEKCTPDYIMKTITAKQSSLGEVYPNVMKLFSVYQTLILSTAPVERVFSRVKLLVTEHRNRLNVSTTSRLLMVALNGKSREEMDFERVVQVFLDRKDRRLM